MTQSSTIATTTLHARGPVHTVQRAEAPADRLRAISRPVAFERGAPIYHQGDAADRIYEIVEGVLKTYSELPDGRTCITAFLFPGDLFGLAEEGRYIHSAAAVTHARLGCVPIDRLTALMRGDAALDWAILCKLCHELREADRHELLLARTDAQGRLAAFIAMLLRIARRGKAPRGELYLPMRRTEIADYIGITREAASRAFKTLETAGIVAVRNRRFIRITDRAAFAALAATGEPDDG